MIKDDVFMKAVCTDPAVMAIGVIAARVRSLPEEDKEDLFEAVNAFLVALKNGDEEGADSASQAMKEILEQEPTRLIPSKPLQKPDSAFAWVDYVSYKIKTLRNKAGLTQTQLAELSGLPQSHISRLENGEHSPSFSTLGKLAKALGVEVSELDPSAPELPHGTDDES